MGMTASRPLLGAVAVYESFHQRPLIALAYLIAAQITDADGYVARKLDATSKIGAYGDTAADCALRVESAAVLATVINPVFAAAALIAEADVLRRNAQHNTHSLQSEPTIPLGAKRGTVAQDIGVSATLLGAGVGNPYITTAGGALVALSSIGRDRSYRNLFRHKRTS